MGPAPGSLDGRRIRKVVAPIGGTVDIVMRKPPDRKPGTLTATADYDYKYRSNRGNFRGSARYS